MTSPALTRRGFLRAAGLGAAVAALPRVGAAEPARKRKPNFIIILADDMGYGDSSVYGGWIRTPHLEALAAAGLKFTDFHASGAVCSPTRAGLLTGRYQERAGIPGVITADPDAPVHWSGLQTCEVTFPKLLKAVGYTSAIFGKWHLGYTKNYNPLHHGFDRFRGYVSGNIDFVSHYDRVGRYDWWEGLEHVREEGYVTHLVTKHAVKFIEANRHRPFCLYIAHEAVHTPLQAPGDPPVRGPDRAGKRVGRPPKETYRLMMKALDEGVGQVVAAVRKAGIADNTLIFFFSDNGATPLGSNAPLRGYKGSVWEGGHREPAIAVWEGRIRPGAVTDQLAISLDLMPTLLELAGASVPAGHSLDGVSLVPLLLEGRPLGWRKLFWRGEAMRDGPWKLIIPKPKTARRGPAGKPSRKPQLYNLAEDIGEKTDLAAKYPDRVRKMLAELEAWRADVARDATPQPKAPPPAAAASKRR